MLIKKTVNCRQVCTDIYLLCAGQFQFHFIHIFSYCSQSSLAISISIITFLFACMSIGLIWPPLRFQVDPKLMFGPLGPLGQWSKWFTDRYLSGRIQLRIFTSVLYCSLSSSTHATALCWLWMALCMAASSSSVLLQVLGSKVQWSSGSVSSCSSSAWQHSSITVFSPHRGKNFLLCWMKKMVEFFKT